MDSTDQDRIDQVAEVSPERKIDSAYQCPECGSKKRFFHCHDRCSADWHIVTCRDCKVQYLTTIRPGEGVGE